MAYLCISGQVDPLHIGEAARAMSIAGHYGQRLLLSSQNIGKKELAYLLSEYPSHGFVIDRGEAERLFKNVRKPTEKENSLAELLGLKSRWPDILPTRDGLSFNFLSREPND